VWTGLKGGAENAELDIAEPDNAGIMRHHIARVDNARPENAAPDQTEVLEQSGAE